MVQWYGTSHLFITAMLGCRMEALADSRWGAAAVCSGTCTGFVFVLVKGPAVWFKACRVLLLGTDSYVGAISNLRHRKR